MITRKKSSDARVLLTLLLALSGFGNTAALGQVNAQAEWQSEWKSPLHQDHPLVGKIWLSAQMQFIPRDELQALLQQNPLLLLGEKHDNPDHHQLRLSLLDSLLSAAGPSLIVMEMMQRGQQPRIAALADSTLDTDLSALAERLAWDDEGWPWQFYGPAVALALQRGASLVAGNIDSSEVMTIYRDTSATMTQRLDAQQLAQLHLDIDSSHCGMLPAEQFPAMVRVQQARDQQMAAALMSGADAFARRILLAGNYHIRHDLGVPNYLDAQTPPLSVAFLEVDPALDDPVDYLQQFSDTAAYDVVWFTPALRQDDYCAEMRATQDP